jgi:hypothetical protein
LLVSPGVRYLIASFAVLAACTQNGDAKDFYDHAEAGSTWALSFVGGDPSGTCPVLVARTVTLPGDQGLTCDPGSTCGFLFELDDNGDLGHNYDVFAEFTQTWSDGASVECIDTDPQHSDYGFCLISPSSTGTPSLSGCSYSFQLTPTP